MPLEPLEPVNITDFLVLLRVSIVLSQTLAVAGLCEVMSLDLNDAAMSGNVEEVIIRLNMGEDPNQKFYPRYN